MWRDSGYRVNHCRLDFLCSQSSAVRKAAIASGTVVARVAWLFRALLVFTHKRVAAAALEKALQPVTVTNVPTPREFACSVACRGCAWGRGGGRGGGGGPPRR